MRSIWLTTALAALALPLVAHATNHPATADSTSTPSAAKAAATLAVPAVAAYVTAAINDPARAADKHIDARRKMAAVMAFTGVKPGDTVIELVPGSGYWTRVFSQIVGSNGHVYTVWPKQMMKFSAKSLAKWKTLSATKHYANVTELVEDAQTVIAPAKADIVFTSQNYHDYHNLGIDIAKFDRSVYKALKPGGAFIVIDHVAPAGSGISDTGTLHRIDPAAAKKEIEAAGLVFAGSSDALHNGADPHTIAVFNKAIRGHTDQFIYRFRKLVPPMAK